VKKTELECFTLCLKKMGIKYEVLDADLPHVQLKIVRIRIGDFYFNTAGEYEMMEKLS
jgi:hypothetical protein